MSGVSGEESSSVCIDPHSELGQVTNELHDLHTTSSNDSNSNSINAKSKDGFLSSVSKFLGSDIMNSHMHVPLWVMEPTTQLMRMAECLEFAGLLNAVCLTSRDDHVRRNSLIAAFVVSAFVHTTKRTGKPFVPVLGETFEYTSTKENYTFYAEQVSVAPSVAVSYVKGDAGWDFTECVDVSAHYYGNTIDVSSLGSRRLRIFDQQDETLPPEIISWNLPTAIAGNLVVGGSFLDHCGPVIITNHTTGYVIRLDFRRMGWLNAGYGEVSGMLLNPDNKPCVRYVGKWFEKLDMVALDVETGKDVGECETLWKVEADEYKVDGDPWNLKPFTYELLGIDPKTKEMQGPERTAVEMCVEKLGYDGCDEVNLPPPTDGRFRRDVMYLALRDNKKAAASRAELESKHRERAKHRQSRDKSSAEAEHSHRDGADDDGKRYFCEKKSEEITETIEKYASLVKNPLPKGPLQPQAIAARAVKCRESGEVMEEFECRSLGSDPMSISRKSFYEILHNYWDSTRKHTTTGSYTPFF
mmetsp:Transcript_12112/g.21898  ORF Transcript_12112/g.21898 Transcript_12112/m.21898 type:complete len:527 (+) Transcript_12112:50-1630(+)|eukprot:CAMPEP_0182449032 /NCGR_PEP_ID=MMETSP1172-20130603/31408_1 /TAXON_ID=708627 /ORGANISM="Timspurckia oligopyrenoides, Strain CCMP3278" /LENGTH=526 /DNA_ID=CAMNT_0024646121 /DNA_START=44 /DNA_END=1624 /DNA_ORIENTATION=-